MPRTVLALTFALLALAATACVKVQPATDTGDPLLPTAPDSPTSGSTSQALAYDPDLRPVFSSDCVMCHGNSRADAGYRMTTYAQVMQAVRPGNASSALVVVTQRNGSMYRYFTGNRTTRAQMVRDWVVANGAAETR
jgi:Planctomycete cytochrome C